MERRLEDEDMKIELKEFIAKTTEWQINTNEYRRSLCSKIDDINKRLGELPCKERNRIYEGLSNQIRWLWGLFIGILGAIISGVISIHSSK